MKRQGSCRSSFSRPVLLAPLPLCSSSCLASDNVKRRLRRERPRVGATSCRWEQALDLLMSIKTRGLTPDVVSFSSAMSACDRAGEWQVSEWPSSLWVSAVFCAEGSADTGCFSRRPCVLPSHGTKPKNLSALTSLM